MSNEPNIEMEMVTVGMLEVNSLLIYDPTTHDGILVDPGDEIDKIVERANSLDLAINRIVLTHGHGDHIGALDSARERFNVRVAIGRHDAEMVTSAEANLSTGLGLKLEFDPAEELLDDGDVITVGNQQVAVAHTPGHTLGSICLIGEGKAAVGDLVFAGSVGRIDLPGGSAESLMQSIKRTILTLPDETILFPGHGPATTVGRERVHNPFLNGSW